MNCTRVVDLFGILSLTCLIAAAYMLGWSRGYTERGRSDAEFMKRVMRQIIDEAVKFAGALRTDDADKDDAKPRFDA